MHTNMHTNMHANIHASTYPLVLDDGVGAVQLLLDLGDLVLEHLALLLDGVVAEVLLHYRVVLHLVWCGGVVVVW